MPGLTIDLGIGPSRRASGGGGTATISGPLTAFTAGLTGSTSATVVPNGTAVAIISVTSGGFPDTLTAHNVVHNGFGTLTTTGAIL